MSGGGSGAESDKACWIIGKDLEGESGDAGSSLTRVTDVSRLDGFILKRRPIDDRDGNNGRVVSLSFLLPVYR